MNNMVLINYWEKALKNWYPRTLKGVFLIMGDSPLGQLWLGSQVTWPFPGHGTHPEG